MTTRILWPSLFGLAWPQFFGLEGRPCIARGEPRCAAEPRECGRRRIRERAQDMATHRRFPSPQQAERCVAGSIHCVRLPTASRPRYQGRRVGDEMSEISQKDKRDEECGNA